MGIFRCSAALLILALPAAAGDVYPVDWAHTNRETLQHFLALLRIDTRNPPGNETRAARYLKAVLEGEGIPAQLFALDPKRASLVARLKGNGAKKPILMMGHTDVVGVQRGQWSVDPFAGVRKDGYVFARGAQDDKEHVTAGLMVLLLLQRLHVPLDRDVIFLAESGEEGTTRVGIDFLAERHWDAIAAEYALAEGGAVVAHGAKVDYVAITTTEKVPRAIRLVAHGTASHGSRPIPDNAVVRLADAVAKAGTWRTPMRLNETTRAYFEGLARISPPEEAARYRGILDPARAPSIDEYFFGHEPNHYSILRTSVVPTMLTAGFRSNVIPSTAEAYLDVRALPDEDMNRFCDELRERIADRSVDVVPPKPGGRPAAPPSRLDTDMFRALERAQRRVYPGSVTLPAMLSGATDMAQLRARGVQAYGYGPLVDRSHAGTGGAHGDDEALAESSLYQLVRFLWYAVLDVAATH